MITLTIDLLRIRVHKHAVVDTGRGVAGYMDMSLPDGRMVVAIGRWDDPRRSGLDDPDWCDERVWVDGALVEPTEEGSYLLDEEAGVTIEDVARRALKRNQEREAALAAQIEDEDVDECHRLLTAADISPGALVERVEDLIDERDGAMAALDSSQRSSAT